MDSLTPRQTEILQMIRAFMAEHGYPPTRHEIAQALGFRSVNAAVDHLKALARKGAIELLPGASRGIRLLGDHDGLPVIGRVAAGSPILAEEHIETRYRLDP
ncbi:MAG: transcriptional repressor LexA, partial [Acidiferrobacterales bacterium]